MQDVRDQKKSKMDGYDEQMAAGKRSHKYSMDEED